MAEGYDYIWSGGAGGGGGGGAGGGPAPKSTVIAEDANWRRRVQSEREAASGWRSEWGFLLGNTLAKDDGDSLEQFKKVAVAKLAAGGLIKVAEDQLAATKNNGKKSMDALEQYMATYEKRMRVKGMVDRLNPMKEANQPRLTSHEVGWHKANLERFGRLTCRLR